MEENNKINIEFFKNIFKGVIISFLLTLLLLFILSVILVNTNISEGIVVPSIITISAISILASSSMITLKVNKKGIISGSIVGIIYIIILYLISSFANLDFSINLNSLIMFLSSIICGAIGGIIGANMRKD